MNDTLGFICFGLPVGILMIWSEIYNYKKQKNCPLKWQGKDVGLSKYVPNILTSFLLPK